MWQIEYYARVMSTILSPQAVVDHIQPLLDELQSTPRPRGPLNDIPRAKLVESRSTPIPHFAAHADALNSRNAGTNDTLPSNTSVSNEVDNDHAEGSVPAEELAGNVVRQSIIRVDEEPTIRMSIVADTDQEDGNDKGDDGIEMLESDMNGLGAEAAAEVGEPERAVVKPAPYNLSVAGILGWAGNLFRALSEPTRSWATTMEK